MSIKDGDDTHWSSNSCEGSDLEEYEARLYSMVYHNSSTYDEPTPAPGKCSDTYLTSTAVNNNKNHTNLVESIPDCVINVESPNPVDNTPEKFPHSSRSKASRLDRVNEIIDIADNKTQPSGTRNRRNKKNKDMYSKKQSIAADVPKTASVFFQNLTKSLNNVQYLQSVETRLPKPLDLQKERSTLANFTFTNKGARVAPLFRLDDRLFPDTPRNASREEVELSHRLFSNQPDDLTSADRHSHRFNQLPTVPVASVKTPTKKPRRKKQTDNARAKRKADKGCAPPPPSTGGDVLPAVIPKLNSLLVQPLDLGDEPVVLLELTDSDHKEETVINLVDEIIDLDSDSDSADSIVVITPPCRTPPPVIALSEDEDREVTAPITVPPPPIHPPLQSEENSFDFLEGSDDPDGLLSRSQLSVFTHLMSNAGGSRESLLDDRLFLRLTGIGDPLEPPNHGAVEPSASNAKVRQKEPIPVQPRVEPSASNTKVRQKEPTPQMDAVVDVVDETSEGSGNVRVRISSTAKTTTLILNVREDSDETSGGKRKRGDRGEGKVARKKRGRRAREKSRHQLQEFLQTRSGMASLLYTKIEGGYTIGSDEQRPRHPTQWTRTMRRHYTDSWGGEAFDVQAVQRTMSADQSLWRISWEDRRGPVPLQGRYRRSRCYNCSRFGHPANTCPEPPRISKCHMCGEPGHREPTCPNKICLQCGRPTPKYSNGCWECQHIPHPLCTRCVWKHDPAVPCMDVGRSPMREPTRDQPDLRTHLEQRKRSRFGDRSLDAGKQPPATGGSEDRNKYCAFQQQQRSSSRRSRP